MWIYNKKREVKKMAKKTGSGTTTKEPVWYGEVATYQHENAGKVMFETVNSANKEVSPTRDSERITRLGKIRVETRVTEWKGTNDNGQVYQKDVETVQINDGNSGPTSSSNNYSSPTSTGAQDPQEPSDGLTPLKVLKNFVDNIAADNRLQWICIVTLGIIAAAALVLALV